jgi:hypothetical protein
MRAEVLDAVAEPFAVLAGDDGEVLAVKRHPMVDCCSICGVERIGRIHRHGVSFTPGSERGADGAMAIDMSELRSFVDQAADLPPTFDSYFDVEADVLYVTFEDADEDDSLLTPNDVVLRYREGRLLSLTILHASKRPGLHVNG